MAHLMADMSPSPGSIPDREGFTRDVEAFTKRYLGKHDVFYQGFNEGKGIWGVWEIPPEFNAGIVSRGGFHIWPEGMPDPTTPHLHEEADVPIHVDELVELETPSGVR